MSFRLGDFKQQIDPKVLEREPGVRADGRGPADLRPVRFTYKRPFADGSTPVLYGWFEREERPDPDPSSAAGSAQRPG